MILPKWIVMSLCGFATLTEVCKLVNMKAVTSLSKTRYIIVDDATIHVSLRKIDGPCHASVLFFPITSRTFGRNRTFCVDWEFYLLV